MSFETSVGTSDADSITVMGRDLSSELLGKVTFTQLAFLLVQRRMPSPEETRLFDAVLISLADHGLTPTVLAARLTHTGAPEALQGAVAAGLLGAGSVFLGVVEDTVRFLDAIGEDVEAGVAREIEAGGRIPGLGHPVHKAEDPRTPRIYAIAEETGLAGTYLGRLSEVASCRSTARASQAPRWPIWASRPLYCADLRCWRGPRGCSVTSRKRCRALLGCVSTASRMSLRSMSRLPGSSGGMQATSGGWQ